LRYEELQYDTRNDGLDGQHEKEDRSYMNMKIW